MISAIRRFLDIVTTISAWIAGLAILAIALIGGLDVFSTAFAGKPLDATVESTEALMVFAAFMGVGLLHRRRAYIAVDMLYFRAGPTSRLVLDVGALLLMTIYFGLIAWRGWVAAFDSLAVREYSSGLIAIPIYPSKFALAFGMTIGTIWCAFDLVTGGRFREAAPSDAVEPQQEI